MNNLPLWESSVYTATSVLICDQAINLCFFLRNEKRQLLKVNLKWGDFYKFIKWNYTSFIVEEKWLSLYDGYMTYTQPDFPLRGFSSGPSDHPDFWCDWFNRKLHTAIIYKELPPVLINLSLFLHELPECLDQLK